MIADALVLWSIGAVGWWTLVYCWDVESERGRLLQPLWGVVWPLALLVLMASWVSVRWVVPRRRQARRQGPRR